MSQRLAPRKESPEGQRISVSHYRLNFFNLFEKFENQSVSLKFFKHFFLSRKCVSNAISVTTTHLKGSFLRFFLRKNLNEALYSEIKNFTHGNDLVDSNGFGPTRAS